MKQFAAFLFCSSLLVACGDHQQGPNQCNNCGNQPVGFSLNLKNASSLAILDESSSNSNALTLKDLDMSNENSNQNETPGGMVVISKAGEVEPAFVPALPEGSSPQAPTPTAFQGSVPRMSAIGFSPTGDIYVLFEHPFLYKVVDDPNAQDIWSPSSIYTCQLFRIKAKLENALAEDVEEAVQKTSNLDCVSSQHEVSTWRQGELMQFDRNGILYFTGHVGGTSRDIFYAYNPESNTLTEKVNGNICYRTVEVTPSGSIFYTGTTKVNEDCSGTSFFRYISNENRLVEISRGWWEYAYETEKNNHNVDHERIIFYGPDPNTNTGKPSWDTACLYRYDPSIEDGSMRATRIAKCLNNLWSWIGAQDLPGSSDVEPSAEVLAAKKERCESENKVFLGGSSVSQLGQDHNGQIFILGDTRKKIAGTFTCNIEMTVDHCASLNPAHNTEELCHAAGREWVSLSGICLGAYDLNNDKEACENENNTWQSFSQWYSNQVGDVCGVQQEGWHVKYPSCQLPDGYNDWTQSLTSFGLIDTTSSDDESEHLITLLSDEDEQAIRFWIIDHSAEGDHSDEKMYYSSYRNGDYLLKAVEPTHDEQGHITGYTSKILLEGYEVYNLVADPKNPSKLLFDALFFETNTYRFGTIDPSFDDASDVEASFTAMDGLTGRIKTLEIVPHF